MSPLCDGTQLFILFILVIMGYDIREALRNYQKESLNKRKEELDRQQAEYQAFLESEDYQREIWENGQDRWEQKAKKEGWHYTRVPFVSQREKQEQAENARLQRVSALKEELKCLLKEQEMEEMFNRLTSQQM